MRRNGIDVELNNIPISELCLLKRECITKNDYNSMNLKFFKGTLLYEVHNSEINEIEQSYSNLYENHNSKGENIAILYEMMVGITKSKIIYPGLDSCIGITIILKDKTKMGIHFYCPTDNNELSIDRYCNNIEKLCSFFSLNYNETDIYSSINKVALNCKKDIESINSHIKDAFEVKNKENITCIKNCFEKNFTILKKIFIAANLNLNISVPEVTLIDEKMAFINSNVNNLYPDIDAKSINVIDE